MEGVMKNRWDSERSLKSEVEELSSKAEHELQLHPSQALIYARQAVDLAMQHPNTAVAVTAKLVLAKMLQKQGIISAALDTFLQVLHSKDEMGDRSGMADILNRVGILYDAMMQPEQAFSYYNRALQAWQSEGNHTGEINTINNIGLIYWQDGELQKAEEAFQQALQYHLEQHNLKGIVIARNNLGAVAFDLGDNATCEMHHLQALQLEQQQEDYRAQSITLSNLGVLKGAQKEWDAALDYFHRALAIAQSHDFNEEHCKVLVNIAEYYQNTNTPQLALKHYLAAHQLAEQFQLKRLHLEIIDGVSQTYAQLNDYQQAYLWAKRKADELAQTYSQERARQAAEHTAHFEFNSNMQNLKLRILKSNEKYRRFMESATEGFALWDDQLALLEANSAFLRLFGLLDEAVVGKLFAQLIDYSEQSTDIITMLSVLKDASSASFERLVRIHNTSLSLVFTVFSLDNMVGMIVRDVTELIQERKRYDDMVQLPAENPDPMIRVDSVGCIVYCNRAAALLMDYWHTTPDELAPEHVRDVAFKSMASQRSLTFEEDVYGRYFSMVVHPAPQQNHVNIYGHDTTTLHESMNMLESILQDKTILIQEIHHRVKNNMQIIMSMLKLQRFNAKHDESKLLLQNSANRVKTMAMVHEKVYQSEDVALVNIPDYLMSLVGMLKRVYMHESRQIDVQYDVRVDSLNLNAAVPFGLIVNEVVSNALRYAFVGRTQGAILVALHRAKDEMLLSIKDDGRGFAWDEAQSESKTMGILLINALVKQLHGRMSFACDGGTTFQLYFKNI
jgi:PAS domain S-box-containing protein